MHLPANEAVHLEPAQCLRQHLFAHATDEIRQFTHLPPGAGGGAPGDRAVPFVEWVNLLSPAQQLVLRESDRSHPIGHPE